MYEGRDTREIKRLSKEYEDKFGYDPRHEMGIIVGNHKIFAEILNRCLKEDEEVFEVIRQWGREHGKI